MSVKVLERCWRCHTGPFRDLTDGISKSGSTSIKYLSAVCVPPEHFQPEAANRFGLASSRDMDIRASHGPCHPGTFFSRLHLQNFKILNIRPCIFLVLFPPPSNGQNTALIMAAVDLSDHDIDQLLSSAELSLAKPADQAVAEGEQHLTFVPKTPSLSTALVGKAGETGKSVTGKPELALRVPQLKTKGKKVRAGIHIPCPTPMRKSYPKLE